MDRREFLKFAATATAATTMAPTFSHAAGSKGPNVLLLTVDDMSCDSIGAFGCKVPDTSPNVDRLASEGVKFNHAHVQVGNCLPSRNVMQTGRYPHTSGVEGFYHVDVDFPILPDLMRENGYYIGIRGKVSHSTPYHPYPWDLVFDAQREKGHGKGNPLTFTEFMTEGIAGAREADKPFYLVCNINDPHTPFYGMAKGNIEVPDKNPPTKIFNEDDIVIPGFLPDTLVVRNEIAHYYSSVRRADDCAAAALKAVKDAGEEDNTVVIFLSDHGMPFPFAKTNVYRHSTQTPWIVKWPGKVKPGTVDNQHVISAIDLMPTILEVAGADVPEGPQGRSIVPILLGKKQKDRDFIVNVYNENSGGMRHPMRSIQGRRFGYIFNPWADGTRKFKTATQGMQTYKEMIRLAENDEDIAARLQLFDYRTVEEFYDYEKDPDALKNRIDDPEFKSEIKLMQRELADWMKRTDDPMRETFGKREDAVAVAAWMTAQDAAAAERKAARGPKRKPSAGQAKGKGKYDPDTALAMKTSKAVERGQKVTVTVDYSIPEKHGEQPIQVTIKSGQRRIDRKMLKAKGAGSLDVTFTVPTDKTVTTVQFAAFIGRDYETCLRHVVTKAIPVK